MPKMKTKKVLQKGLKKLVQVNWFTTNVVIGIYQQRKVVKEKDN